MRILIVEDEKKFLDDRSMIVMTREYRKPRS